MCCFFVEGRKGAGRWDGGKGGSVFRELRAGPVVKGRCAESEKTRKQGRKRRARRRARGATAGRPRRRGQGRVHVGGQVEIIQRRGASSRGPLGCLLPPRPSLSDEPGEVSVPFVRDRANAPLVVVDALCQSRFRGARWEDPQLAEIQRAKVGPHREHLEGADRGRIAELHKRSSLEEAKRSVRD